MLRFSSAKGTESVDALVADTQKTAAALLDYMTRMGVSPSILQAMSATREIRWLSESEAIDFKLSTDHYAAS